MKKQIFALLLMAAPLAACAGVISGSNVSGGGVGKHIEVETIGLGAEINPNWDTTDFSVIQLGDTNGLTSAISPGYFNVLVMTQNAVHTGGFSFDYQADGAASYMVMYDEYIALGMAVSGLAGDSVSFDDIFQIRPGQVDVNGTLYSHSGYEVVTTGPESQNISGEKTFTGKTTFTNEVLSTKSCATGYTRLTPNYCDHDTKTRIELTRNACTTIATPSSNSKGFNIHGEVNIIGSAAGGGRYTFIEPHTTSGCSALLDGKVAIANTMFYEVPATPGQNMAWNDDVFKFHWTQGAAFYLKMQDDAQATSRAYYTIDGYYD